MSVVKHILCIQRAIIRSAIALLFMSELCGCGRQPVSGREMNSPAFPQERSLPDGTFYKSEFKATFPSETMPDSGASNIYVGGAVRKPQTIKFREGMTLGAAISACGGFEGAFSITVVRRQNEVYSVIGIGLGAEVYKPTGYEQIPLRRDDLVIIGRESY
jgi:hypothetical protein